MKVFHLDRENTLSVSLFSDVTNSKRRRTSWKIISRWEIDAKLSPGRKGEWSNTLDEQSRWVLAIGLESSMMNLLENTMAYSYFCAIAESLKRCRISQSSTYILAARFNASPLELPLSLLKTAQGHPMLVELKNGETYNGQLL
ncbi:uncharacterized protein LOC130496208 isoform X2 [Raphanus sativus]|uniref:Uncharacterized protein LOC130496208 isoform X2 n=1 Tax=Raphanus sativus TaxID=3726 RepID=A0A9W3BXS6_RAPSA|nr:uncharacterized protein LOC130496208 isoform X2 [Raphanus sativus]